jgi:beta-lactamase class A
MRVLRSVFAAVAACATLVFSAAPCSAAALSGREPFHELQAELRSASARLPGAAGIVVKDLATGYSSSVNAGANMPAASVIKIPVMVEVFRQMSLGAFDLNRTLHLQASDRDWGWGDMADAPIGTKRTVSQLLQLMITESDNTATNELIRLVGRGHINATMADLGMHHTVVGDYIRSDGDIRSLRTTPGDMSSLLEAMFQHRLIDEWSSRAMLAILVGQHHNGLLPEPLPHGLPIAHKTGTLHDTLNDVGIVFLRNEPYIIAVMTTNLPTLDTGRRFIRGVSRMAYSALERFATWRLANNIPSLEADAQPHPAVAVPPDVQMWETPVRANAATLPLAPTPEPSVPSVTTEPTDAPHV